MGGRASGQQSDVFEHVLIVSRFVLGLHGEGSGRTGHAVKAQRTAIEGEGPVFAHLHASGIDAIVSCEERGGQLTGTDDSAQTGEDREKSVEVGGFYHFEILVGGSTFCAPYARAGVVEGDTFLSEKFLECLLLIGLMLPVDEVFSVVEEDQTDDAPHIIGEVRIVPGHAPSFGCRREGAEHQQACFLGEEGFERMDFDIIHNNSILPAAGWLQADTTDPAPWCRMPIG